MEGLQEVINALSIVWVAAIFYFRLRLYGYQDGHFCLIFARTAQQSVGPILDGTNGLSSSKPCAYCQIVQSGASRGSLCNSTTFLLHSQSKRPIRQHQTSLQLAYIKLPFHENCIMLFFRGIKRHPWRRKMRHRNPWGTKIRKLGAKFTFLF